MSNTFTPTLENTRALGIGERVEEGDYGRLVALGADAPLVRVKDYSVGHIVSQDDNVEFRRPVLASADQYETGAIRSDASGRGRFDLVPYEAMLCLAKRLEYGVKSGYAERNWEKGMPLSRILSSMRRHAMQIKYDFSEDHLGAVLFNAAAFVTISERIRAGILPKTLDDLGYLERTQS